ncbi:hypothetical protein DY000_02014547 [Brassica cretica]|uniref:Uncharacterized protein n=1 Tax=Brassica cretica TaxID=69181 RepID=A0ABQ7CRP3_BRACR|nr:hypothetical protein DY000_02014547 [Brassica cretica]
MRARGISIIKRPDDTPPPFKSGCSAYGRPETYDAVANSWKWLCFYWILRFYEIWNTGYMRCLNGNKYKDKDRELGKPHTEIYALKLSER